MLQYPLHKTALLIRLLPLHLVGHTAVHVQRERGRVVPQHRRERFRVHAVLQHHCGECVRLGAVLYKVEYGTSFLWTDLDIEKRTISEKKTVDCMGKDLLVSEPKTPHLMREMTIPRQAVDILVKA